MKKSFASGLMVLTIVVSVSRSACAEDPHIAPVAEYFRREILPWANDPLIIEAVKQQNIKTRSFDQAHIDALDREWRTGADGGNRELIDRVLDNDLSKFLHEKQTLSNGTIGEVFVMDAKGLIVGESDITSDYWQGDEEKFQNTFGVGKHGFFVDKVMQDESTQALQSQASMTIEDENGQPIGALTVGVNIEAF